MAVLFVKKGVRNHTSIQVLQDFIFRFQEGFLKSHFLSEEMAFRSFLNRLPAFQSFYSHMVEEHEKIIAAITPENSTINREAIQSWAQQLEQLVRFKERELFPFLERNLNEQELKSIAHSVQPLKSEVCMSYPIRFWE